MPRGTFILKIPEEMFMHRKFVASLCTSLGKFTVTGCDFM